MGGTLVEAQPASKEMTRTPAKNLVGRPRRLYDDADLRLVLEVPAGDCVRELVLRGGRDGRDTVDHPGGDGQHSADGDPDPAVARPGARSRSQAPSSRAAVRRGNGHFFFRIF